ncbi:MAG: hypothetical protein IJQ00_06990, partial [Kiritimatiellae bacterium]|nr:hypothetical protein [Kiritimatiellia bacterium]
VNAPESAQIGRPNLKATRRNVVALSKVRQNWYVYFRDGAFTFARYVNDNDVHFRDGEEATFIIDKNVLKFYKAVIE